MKKIFCLLFCFLSLHCMDDEQPAKKRKVDNVEWVDNLWDSYAQEKLPQYVVIGAFENALKYGHFEAIERFLKKGVLNVDGNYWLKSLYNSGYRSLNWYRVIGILKDPRNRSLNPSKICKLLLLYTPVQHDRGFLLDIEHLLQQRDQYITGIIGKLLNVYWGWTDRRHDNVKDNVALPLCCRDVVHAASKIFLARDTEESVCDAKLVIISALWTLFYEVHINGPLEGYFDATAYQETRIANFFHCYRYAQLCGLSDEFDAMPFTGRETEDHKKLMGKYQFHDQLQNNQRLAQLSNLKFAYH